MSVTNRNFAVAVAALAAAVLAIAAPFVWLSVAPPPPPRPLGAGFPTGYYLPAEAGTGATVYGLDSGAWTVLPAGDAGTYYQLGANGLPYWGSVASVGGGGLGPTGTITAPPAVTLNDAGGWLWVNQQGTAFTNASNGLLLTTTYNGTGTPFGALVHPLAGSATASVAASHVWTSAGTGNTSASYVGFGVAMFCSTSNQWAAFTIVDYWVQSSFTYVPFFQVNYFTGTSLTSNTNVESALMPRGYVILRMRMTGTLNTSPVDFEVSEDGVTYSLVKQVINSTLFGSGNLPTDMGVAFALPSNSGMTGNTNATVYNYVETN